MPIRLSRRQIWTRNSLALCGWVLALCVPGAIVESVSHGPFTRWYNERMHDRAQAAALIGAPESAIVPALGEPSHVWHSWSRYRDGSPTPDAVAITTYNYRPHLLSFGGKFQVHLREGRVTSLERLDD